MAVEIKEGNKVTAHVQVQTEDYSLGGTFSYSYPEILELPVEVYLGNNDTIDAILPNSGF